MPLTQVQGQMLTGGALNVGNNTLGAGNASAFKNRIINGQMQIDQRNAGASTTASNNYPLDRFNVFFSDGTVTRQQSSTVPAGFSNSLSLTVTSSSAGNSSTRALIEQRIEGFNVTDLGFGTANTQNFTVSFWCRSSVSGTYSGSITDTSTRSYPFSFSIPSTNTWVQISVTITPDTSGSNWSKTNGTGLAFRICLGSGSSFLGTANAWASGNLDGVTGTTNWLSNAGATFFLTGVQLEVGSTATSFDYRPYGTELALCQRYYYQMNGLINQDMLVGAAADQSTWIRYSFPLPVIMRTTPTLVSTAASTYRNLTGSGNQTGTSIGLDNTTSTNVTINLLSSGITTGSAATFRIASNPTGYIGFSAEF